MDILGAFRIPVSALRADETAYSWTLEPEFFTTLDEDHPAPDGRFRARLVVHRTAGVATMDFLIEGEYNTACDRCTAPISMPVAGEYQVIVKTGNPDESTDEVIFLEPEETAFSVAQLVYDFALLSIPIMHRLDGCETMDPSPCDASVLVHLKKFEDESRSPEKGGFSWDDLKNAFDN
jgi:uncharacterized metal-binding protein YceD (DUF177 family)